MSTSECQVCRPTDLAWHDVYTGRSVRAIKADQDQGHCENCWGPQR